MAWSRKSIFREESPRRLVDAARYERSLVVSVIATIETSLAVLTAADLKAGWVALGRASERLRVRLAQLFDGSPKIAVGAAGSNRPSCKRS